MEKMEEKMKWKRCQMVKREEREDDEEEQRRRGKREK